MAENMEHHARENGKLAWKYYEENQSLITRIAALEAQLAERVKVKPLEWEEVTPKVYDALGIGILYRATQHHDGTGELRVDNTRNGDVYLSFSEAKAAAQADYERRILSALEATPPAPKVTEVETAIAAASEYCWQRYKGRDPLNLKSPAVFTSHEHQKLAEYIRAALTAAQESGQ